MQQEEGRRPQNLLYIVMALTQAGTVYICGQ